MFLQYNAIGEITARLARQSIHHAKWNVTRGNPWGREERAKGSSRATTTRHQPRRTWYRLWHLVRVEINSKGDRKHGKESSSTTGSHSFIKNQVSCKPHTQAAGESWGVSHIPVVWTGSAISGQSLTDKC